MSRRARAALPRASANAMGRSPWQERLGERTTCEPSRLCKSNPEVPDLDAFWGKRPIELVLRKYKLGDEPSEPEEWADRTPEERLQALLDMRERYARWKYGVEPRLETVLAVARRA